MMTVTCTPSAAASTDDELGMLDVCFPSRSSLDVEAVAVDAGSVSEAAGIFRENGFVILRGALCEHDVKEVYEACTRLHENVRRIDPEGLGNRNPQRYSMGSLTPSRSCMHLSSFLHLLTPSVLALMDRIFNGCFLVSGLGGDYCTGLTWEFQKLHSDMRPARPLKGKGSSKSKMKNAPVHCKDFPPLVCVNYAVQDLTAYNGPMRIVSWTEMAAYCQDKPWLDAPSLGDELEKRSDWLRSKVFPLQAGDCLVRDVRVWHGGCPNLSGEARYLPALEAISHEYFTFLQTTGPKQEPALPLKLYKTLPEAIAVLCNHAVSSGSSPVDAHVDDYQWLKADLRKPPRDDYYLPLYELMREDHQPIIEVLQKLNGQRCLESVPSLVAQMHGGARDLLHTLAARDARLHETLLELMKPMEQPRGQPKRRWQK
ncbi:unnamed protein product [Symbiodinium necroappetens]|uniref:Phytanoyl-CoA dioxygenase n=1 Tax=Symbiodinium necroappetens TaxID=1628268 RepID=A0A813C5P6_9DINO|nr:unnamed protein product [Symbiodinium necroappetens]